VHRYRQAWSSAIAKGIAVDYAILLTSCCAKPQLANGANIVAFGKEQIQGCCNANQNDDRQPRRSWSSPLLALPLAAFLPPAPES